MKITILVEGKTETTFIPILREFLKQSLAGRMPKLDSAPYDGTLPTKDKLKRDVLHYLKSGSDHVIALTDVYTGDPKLFIDALDAKEKMRDWVGDDPRFHPHAAQFEFEAWLLPYWPQMQKLAGSNRAPPPGSPELVNHDHPPSKLIGELFGTGTRRKSYMKARDAGRILRDNGLKDAISACTELRAFVNTILRLSGADEIP